MPDTVHTPHYLRLKHPQHFTDWISRWNGQWENIFSWPIRNSWSLSLILSSDCD